MAAGGIAADSYVERAGNEMALANIETRLREMIIELTSPTIHKVTLAASDLDDVKGMVQTHARSIQELQLGQFHATEQVSTILSFKEEMGRWDAQRRAHESSLDEKQEAMQQKLDAFQYGLEQKESALHHLQRSVDRTAAELNHVTEEAEIQREAVEARLDEITLKVGQARADAEVRVRALELQHHELTDELWGEETGLAKVTGELKKTNLAFASLQEAVALLQSSKAEAAALEVLRHEAASMVNDANLSVAAMRQSVGNVVNDVREHFRTASQTIAAHNATFITEVRSQYQEELAAAARLRDEVQEFVAQTGKRIGGLDTRVAEASAKAGSLAAEAREELEELNRRRKRDKTSSDNELKALKKRLGGVFDNSDMVLRGLEHIYGVLQTVLQGELMQCSMERQDSIDRKRIALMGVKDDEAVLARSCQLEPQRARPECRQKAVTAYPASARGAASSSTARGGDPPGKRQEPVVKVDNRCLSCSGQAPMVLSAFKMACLQYTPSPVEHDGERLDRDDLLQQRHALLQSAHASLAEGPGGAKATGADLTRPPALPLAAGTEAAAPAGASTRHTVSGALSLEDAASPRLGSPKRGDAFSEYAAMEARLAGGSKAADSTVRLPNLPAGTGRLASPPAVALTAR